MLKAKNSMKIISNLGFLLLFLTSPLIAQDMEEKKSFEVREPQRFESTHLGTFGGQKITYKAILSETFLKNSSAQVTAALWSTAYVKEGANISNRPVLFVFNGGPGSASIWLHVGFFGPKVVKVDSQGKVDDGAAPYQFVENKGI
jgi:carboxypeptidase C (cathepsin A)